MNYKQGDLDDGSIMSQISIDFVRIFLDTFPSTAQLCITLKCNIPHSSEV